MALLRRCWTAGWGRWRRRTPCSSTSSARSVRAYMLVYNGSTPQRPKNTQHTHASNTQTNTAQPPHPCSWRPSCPSWRSRPTPRAAPARRCRRSWVRTARAAPAHPPAATGTWPQQWRVPSSRSRGGLEATRAAALAAQQQRRSLPMGGHVGPSQDGWERARRRNRQQTRRSGRPPPGRRCDLEGVGERAPVSGAQAALTGCFVRWPENAASHAEP